ncbi:MAG: hypothetical protein HYV90_02500 [Candidatus Woesebacteria bacterium]|nr:MAG: hypothetical protein HYV90_02500 [Candidatus Woesebacteria bacterium]
MSDDFKEKVAANAGIIAIVSATIMFLISYLVLSNVTQGNWLKSLVVAAVFFGVTVLGVWLMASQVVDAYTLDAADNIGDVNNQLKRLRGYAMEIKDPAVKAILGKISKDTVALVKFTRRHQPSSLLSCATVLEAWFEMIIKNAAKCAEVGQETDYFKNQSAIYKTALKGFEGFDQFLINSINLITAGSDPEFEANSKMLDASRFNLI